MSRTHAAIDITPAIHRRMLKDALRKRGVVVYGDYPIAELKAMLLVAIEEDAKRWADD